MLMPMRIMKEVLIVMTLSAVSCGGDDGIGKSVGSGGTGGTATGGKGGGASGGQAGAPLLGPDGFSSECPEELPKPPQANGRLGVDLAVQLGGKPLVFGEENRLEPKGSLMPTNLRFYLSQFTFRKGSLDSLGTLTTAEGSPFPYGVHLVNLEDAASLKFAVSVPPGTYESVTFTLGLTDGCNDTFRPRKPPLDEASQMKWPHTLGFLFLRYEGKRSADVDSKVPDKIHMGTGSGERKFAPRVTVQGPFDVAGADSKVKLTFKLDEVLKAVQMETDLSTFALPEPAPPGPIGEEILAGERLRQHANDVTIFRHAP